MRSKWLWLPLALLIGSCDESLFGSFNKSDPQNCIVHQGICQAEVEFCDLSTEHCRPVPPYGLAPPVEFQATRLAELSAVAPQDMAVGDFNNDKRPDILVWNNNTSILGLLLSQPSGGYSGKEVRIGSYQITSAVIADVDGDQRLDIVLGQRRRTALLLMRGQDNQTFSPPQVVLDLMANTDTTAVAVTDA